MHQASSSCVGTGRPSFCSAYWIEPVMPGFGSVRVPSRSKKMVSMSAGSISRRCFHAEKVTHPQMENSSVAGYIDAMRRDDVIARLKATEPALRGFGVAALYLFGSHARGDAQPDSDIDVFVDPAPDKA